MTEDDADARRVRRRLLLGCAGVALSVAVVLSVDGAAAGLVSAVREEVDSDYLLVMAFGGVAVALAAVAGLSDRSGVRLRTPPEVERPTPAPEPGERLDEQLDSWRLWLPFVGNSTRETVRERLRSAAVRAVAVDRGWSDRRAAAAVEDGSWTDDPVAAGFAATDSGPTLGVVLRAVGSGETPLRYRVRRTVDAVENCGSVSR